MSSIIILASRSRTSYTLINYLAQHVTVSAVVFEARDMRKMLRYRLRTLGWWTVVNQLAFMVYDRLVIRPRSQATIDQLLADYDDSPPDDRLTCIDVEKINSKTIGDLFREHEPACVVVSGTGILSKKVLALAPVFINIHVGITPRYRGVHGGFWAIYENRPELAGVTIHQIDPGVDTGAIIAQETITVDPNADTYRTLPVKQYIAGFPLMLSAVQSALDNTLTTYTRNDLDSQQWYSPTLLQYRQFLRNLAKLKK